MDKSRRWKAEGVIPVGGKAIDTLLRDGTGALLYWATIKAVLAGLTTILLILTGNGMDYRRLSSRR